MDNPDRERLQKLKRELEKEPGEIVNSWKRAAADLGQLHGGKSI
ncbi:hypothetical protein [Streptomyces sp. NPDC007929]